MKHPIIPCIIQEHINGKWQNGIETFQTVQQAFIRLKGIKQNTGSIRIIILETKKAIWW